jgi:ABC-type enterobactin transport system permease subunit
MLAAVKTTGLERVCRHNAAEENSNSNNCVTGYVQSKQMCEELLLIVQDVQQLHLSTFSKLPVGVLCLQVT